MNRYTKEGYVSSDKAALENLRMFGDVLELREFWRLRRWQHEPTLTWAQWLKAHPIRKNYVLTAKKSRLPK